MSYAVAAELRARYAQDPLRDEFAAHADAHLDQALAAASAEIDSWRPPVALGVAATAVLKDKCLTLARMLAHQDQPLEASHPIVREGLAVRAWLKALSAGAVRLPADPDAAAGGSGGPQASAPAPTFDAATLADY